MSVVRVVLVIGTMSPGELAGCLINETLERNTKGSVTVINDPLLGAGVMLTRGAGFKQADLFFVRPSIVSTDKAHRKKVDMIVFLADQLSQDRALQSLWQSISWDMIVGQKWGGVWPRAKKTMSAPAIFELLS